MFLERISNFLVKNRKKIFFYSLFAVFIFIALHDVSFANDAGGNTSTTTDKTNRTEILNTLLASISAIAGVMIYFVTMLLDPGFTSGTTFGINDNLHKVWILVSNIVYFIFAFILIWIAFMNIIGKGDKWELKQAMPKFIIGVLIVPFSWFIVSVVVSLANILTIAALTLPSESFPAYQQGLENIELKTDCELDFKKLSADAGNTDSWYGCKGKPVKLGATVKDSAFGLVSAYVYGLIKIDDLPEIKKQQLANKAINNLLDMILFIVFNILFVLVFFILIVTLGIVLLVRIIWLWVYMALSPLFGLAYFFGKDGGGDLMKKFNFTEFLGLAMVPVYATLALSFGFVFLHVTMQGLEEGGNQGDGNMFKIKDNTINFTPGISDENGKDVVFKFKVTGGPFSQLNKNNSDNKESFMYGLKGSALGFIGAIFMNIFGVVIFRIAIMAALQSSSITKELVAPIKQFGDSVGSLVAKAPTYAPVFGGVSATGLNRGMQNITSHIGSKSDATGTKFSKYFTGDNNNEKVINAINRLKTTKEFNETSTRKSIAEAIAEKKTLGKMVDDTQFKDFMKLALDALIKSNPGDKELKSVVDNLKLGNKKDMARAIRILDKYSDKDNYGTILSGKDNANYTITGASDDISYVEKKLNPLASTTNNINEQTTQNISINIPNITNSGLKDGKVEKGKEEEIAKEIKAKLGDVDISGILLKDFRDKLDDLIYADENGLKEVIENLEKLYGKKFKK